MDRLLPIIDVREETHLKDTLAHRRALPHRSGWDRRHHLAIDELHHGQGDVDLIDLLSVQTD